jgi:hypothetical protein
LTKLESGGQSARLAQGDGMADYERITAAPVREVLRLAGELLPQRLPLEKVDEDSHSITFRGGDGTVTFGAHRHGFETVVHATTDQVRTSRLDLETQFVLNRLPYQPGDRPGR